MQQVSTFRQTPISCLLVGAAKIGKSHFVIKLTKAINDRLFKVKFHTHCMTSTTKHLDGYIQQPIFVLDDHYKMCDGKQEIDASIVFNCVSCTTYYPSFACIENKGLTFNSKFVIITSNYGYPVTCYLSSALHRRHKHHVILIKNSDVYDSDFNHLNIFYTKEIIDPWQGAYTFPYSQEHDVPFTMNEFNRSFPFRNRYRRINFDALIQILIDDYLHEKKIFEDVVNK